MNTFYKWLINQNYRNDTIGSIACLLIKEGEDNLPTKKTKNNILSYLIASRAEEKILIAFNKAWYEYKQYRKLN